MPPAPRAECANAAQTFRRLAVVAEGVAASSIHLPGAGSIIEAAPRSTSCSNLSGRRHRLHHGAEQCAVARSTSAPPFCAPSAPKRPERPVRRRRRSRRADGSVRRTPSAGASLRRPRRSLQRSVPPGPVARWLELKLPRFRGRLAGGNQSFSAMALASYPVGERWRRAEWRLAGS